MPPRFTIITVVWNSLAELQLTRLSVAAQYFSDYEHLIVDGASTDGTVEWLQHIDDPNVRWVSEPDEGIYDAMNKAASMALGEYLVFLNAGDTLRDARVLSRWASAIQDAAPRWQYARAVVVDDERRPIRPDYGLRRYSTFAHAYQRGALCHQAVAMQRDFFDELGGFQLHHGIVADYGLLLKAGCRVRPLVIDSIDIDYLDGGASASIAKGQLTKHSVRSEILGYTGFRRRLDYLFAREQEAEIKARKRLKRVLLASRAKEFVHRRAGRNASAG